MTWMCPQDGTEVDDATSTCALCGYMRIPGGIALRSDATGKEIQLRINDTLGGAAFRQFDDPEVRYVSAEQCRVEKRADQGGWVLLDVPHAVNRTFLNGAPLDPAGVLLRDGDRLSIKDKFFRLTVRLLS